MGGAAVSAQVFAGVDARLSRYSYLVSLLPQTGGRRARAAHLADAQALLLVHAGARPPRRPRPPGRQRRRRAHAASFRAVTGGDAAHAAWQRASTPLTHEVAQRLWPTVTEPLRAASDVRVTGRRRTPGATWSSSPVGETVAERFGDDTVAGCVLTDALIGTFADVDDPDLAAEPLLPLPRGRRRHRRLGRARGRHGRRSAAPSPTPRRPPARPCSPRRGHRRRPRLDPPRRPRWSGPTPTAASTGCGAGHVLAGVRARHPGPAARGRRTGEPRRGRAAQGEHAAAAAPPAARGRRPRRRVQRHLPRQRDRHASCVPPTRRPPPGRSPTCRRARSTATRCPTATHPRRRTCARAARRR